MSGRVSSIVAFACTALLVACQSGPDRLSAEEFREQANAACAQAVHRVEDLDPVDVGNQDAAVEAVEATTEIQQRLRDRIDELVPPAAGQRAYDGWLRQMDVVLEQLGRLAAALQAGDAAGEASANQAGSEAVAAAWDAARELGADGCVDTPLPGTGSTTAP